MLTQSNKHKIVIPITKGKEMAKTERFIKLSNLYKKQKDADKYCNINRDILNYMLLFIMIEYTIHH